MDPTPNSLTTSTCPPIFSIMFLHIESPRPVPFLLMCLFSSSMPKFWKRLSMPYWVIPYPVSSTHIWKHSLVSSFKLSYKLIYISPPSSVNLRLLFKKLRRNCSYLLSSPLMRAKSFRLYGSSMVALSSTPLSKACRLTMSRTRTTVLLRSKTDSFNVNSQFSSLARSKMSLIKFSNMAWL